MKQLYHQRTVLTRRLCTLETAQFMQEQSQPSVSFLLEVYLKASMPCNYNEMSISSDLSRPSDVLLCICQYNYGKIEPFEGLTNPLKIVSGQSYVEKIRASVYHFTVLTYDIELRMTEYFTLLFICNHMSRDMRFPTMWYVRPAKPQISLRISAV